jgi:uncharacterized membrane protein SirB2
VVDVRVPDIDAAHVDVRLLATGTARPDRVATRIPEVTINGVANPPVAATIPSTCHTDLATVDGNPIGIRLSGSTSQLLNGEPVEASLCDPIELTAGWHVLRSSNGLPLSRLVLTTPGLEPKQSQDHAAEIAWDSDTSAHISVNGGDRVTLGQGMSDDWSASVNGTSIGRPIELDTQTAWVIRAQGPATVDATFARQRTSDALLILSGMGLMGCTALVIFDPKGVVAPARARRRGRHFKRTGRLLGVAAIAFAGVVGGAAGVVLATVAVIALRRQWVSDHVVAVICVAYIVAAVLLSVPPLAAEAVQVSPVWPVDRIGAHETARMAVVLLAVLMAGRQRPT